MVVRLASYMFEIENPFSPAGMRLKIKFAYCVCSKSCRKRYSDTSFRSLPLFLKIIL